MRASSGNAMKKVSKRYHASLLKAKSSCSLCSVDVKALAGQLSITARMMLSRPDRLRCAGNRHMAAARANFLARAAAHDMN